MKKTTDIFKEKMDELNISEIHLDKNRDLKSHLKFNNKTELIYSLDKDNKTIECCLLSSTTHEHGYIFNKIHNSILDTLGDLGIENIKGARIRGAGNKYSDITLEVHSISTEGDQKVLLAKEDDPGVNLDAYDELFKKGFASDEYLEKPFNSYCIATWYVDDGIEKLGKGLLGIWRIDLELIDKLSIKK